VVERSLRPLIYSEIRQQHFCLIANVVSVGKALCGLLQQILLGY